jgi:hypothetical protein
VNPAYEPKGRSRLYDPQGRERQRVKRCADDRAVLSVQDGILCCPECGRTAEQMAQAPS